VSALRTYSHLADAAGAAGRLPSDYEITTSRLLYYVERGFEVATDVGRFHARHQQAFPLVCRDWERFADPRETTYSKYVALQAARETYVDGLLDSMETATPPYDARLPPDWTATTAARLAVLRFPLHGLQMVAAYVGHLAPTGRLVTALLMQAADEVRRVQRFSRRVAGMARGRSGVAAAARDSWQNEPAWQPLRRVVERLLVTYDWGEALVALELVVKPAFDELALAAHADFARAHGDHLLAEMLDALYEDSRWQRAWTGALVRVLLDDAPGNAALLARWSDTWAAAVEPALEAAAPPFGLAAREAAARVRAWRAGLLATDPGDDDRAR
jgi:toluene monooxygenase system protein E